MSETQMQELLVLLRLADEGRLPIEELPRRRGDPAYSVLGWTFTAFNDAGSWDYIGWVRTPYGEEYDYAQIPERLRDWSPNNEERWNWPPFH